ncbi:MAG: DNA polymerase III, subunit gamma and tau [Gammaproteobacteria bacterium RIFCSPHIGHO2_12_FULL_38_14]|nr:MAG: DNA polymerase III, subunit gamma and tau [Gammaproteobacteria bacterium RIFCSPHIGHO2_12_FULL_38_14]
MNYQVLARKWRPRSFQDMVGQPFILQTLTNALQQQRLHHAYLFTGTRGVGKTTLARIMAKALNCEQDITPFPCGSCHACTAIDQGQFLDLFEIDAASRTKVEDTRELLDNIAYPPAQGRYKIYIIDEVHMLSNHSFNALLKTLEEPPSHVKFLLATTEPKRLPITIISRCLQFHLKEISEEQIAAHLKHICETEKVTFEDTALYLIAKAAKGSMRDALSLLDQCIAYGNGEVNKQDVQSMLGSIIQDDLQPLLEALAERDGKKLIQVIEHFASRALDFHQVLEEMISLLHHIALAQVLPDSTIHTATIKALAQQFTPEDIQLYYQIALIGRRDLPLTPSTKQGFEMILLRMFAFDLKLSLQHNHQISEVNKTENYSPPPEVRIEKNTAPATTSKVETTNWRELVSKLELSGMAYALASNCTLDKIEENKVFLSLSKNHEPMLNTKLKERIEEALARHYKQTMQLIIQITSNDIVTPYALQQHEKTAALEQATQTALEHPKIKQLIELCDATVDVSLG